MYKHKNDSEEMNKRYKSKYCLLQDLYEEVIIIKAIQNVKGGDL
jgi:hypothetical protein